MGTSGASGCRAVLPVDSLATNHPATENYTREEASAFEKCSEAELTELLRSMSHLTVISPSEYRKNMDWDASPPFADIPCLSPCM